MNKRLLAVVVVAGLALVGCNSHNRNQGLAQNRPLPVTGPTDFTSFLGQTITQAPAFGAATPVQTGSLTNNLSLNAATAFANANFGVGDTLPAGTFQASVACTQVGPPACDPGTSADLNSTLN